MAVDRAEFSREGLPAEIQQNDLASSTAEFMLWIAPRLHLLAMGAVLVALVVAGWVLVSSQREATTRSGWDEWLAAVGDPGSDGFTGVIDRYPETPAALWSRLLLAERSMGEGCQQLFGDRARGRERLRAAVDLYTVILAERPTGMAAEQAVFGLAKAREALGELDAARQGYQSLVSEYPDSPLRPLAERRVAALARGATRDWYDWFQSQEMTAPAQAEASGNGDEKPVESQPAEPEPADGGSPSAAPDAPAG